MKELSLPENYFEPVYECPDCKDTGYIDGKPCHCFKQQAIDLIYTQSNIKDILARENFSTLSLDYYSDSNINPATGLTSLATAKAAVARCHEFVDQFDTTFANLYFFGDTGIGKTFLSNCIAKELLDSGHSVIYFTAFQLFDILSKGVFEKDADAIATHQNIFGCDLLIIDDLGAERSTDFALEKVYDIVDSRYRAKLPIILTTNLSMTEMKESADIRYTRIYDRIFEMCYPMQFTGRSWRKAEAARRFDEMKNFLEGNDG